MSVLAATAVIVPAAAAAGTCSSVSASPLMFSSGIVAGGTTKTYNTSTTISVKCTSATSFSVLLGQGLHATGSGMSAVRQLSGSAGSLSYGLYQDSAHSTPWGDGTNVGAGESGFGDGNVEPFLVYAALTVPSSAAVGSYSDTVLVTVSF